jgi:hypothetical protein
MNFPCTAIGSGQEIFIATAGFGKASCDVAYFAFRSIACVILRDCPHRGQSREYNAQQ